MKRFFSLTLALLLAGSAVLSAQEVGALNNTKVNGFRGIWFDLGQKTEYGSKYSGGFATYTMKHRPLAIYAPEVDRTYFVYGGTPDAKERHLLCMVSCYDHKTGMVKKPTVVYDKGEVNDPHDNPALLIDAEGYIWVYVAGRANKRPGFRYKSTKPWEIDEFEYKGESIMAYPQPYYVEGKGHFLFFTRYDGVRRLFFQTSPDGENWSDYQQIASIIEPDFGETKSGHYQITAHLGDKLCTAFNRHFNGNCDTRTDIFFLQTTDFGKTWTTVDGTVVELPLTRKDNPALILDLEDPNDTHHAKVDNNARKANCYIKDVNFDKDGNPIILYVKTMGCYPGPKFGPREWVTAHWNGKEWEHRYITSSTHNYDSGCIWVEGNEWTVIAPLEVGQEKWGQGGEVVAWRTTNAGKKWKKVLDYTEDSPRNHSYVRRPVDAKDPFYAFWCDGNPDGLSISYLYFGDSKGNVWQLPYKMKEESAKPKKVEFPLIGK